MNAKLLEQKKIQRQRRKNRVRGKVFGTAEKPRLSVFRSNKHFYAQVIDDVNGKTLAAINGGKEKMKANKEDVKKLGTEFGTKLKDLKVETVVFDRNGYLYHGVVAAFADAVREAGIKF